MLPAAGRARRRLLHPPEVCRWRLLPWVAVGRRLCPPPVPTSVSLRMAGSSSGARNRARRLALALRIAHRRCADIMVRAMPHSLYGPRNRL